MNTNAIRTRLQRRRAELANRLERITKDVRHTPGLEADFEEQAVQRENDDVLANLDDKIRLELLQIESALSRFDEAVYGICGSCHKPIAAVRLDASRVRKKSPLGQRKGGHPMKREELSLLFSRVHSMKRSVLSVYLNVDQSQPMNLSRGFETQWKKLVASVRRAPVDILERERLEAAVHHIQDFLSAYSPAAKSLVLFFDVTDGFFWHEDFEFPVTNQIRWDRELLLQPLANAMDQLEAYGVVLVGRAKARLFRVALGRIEEVIHEELDAKAVRHLKTTGTDHTGWSSRVQRKADNQVRMNLRRVVKDMEWLVKEAKLQRFVLAGTPEIIAELRNLLPGRVASLVIGQTHIARNAVPSDVLAATQPLAENCERDTEVEKVGKIVTSAAKKGKAVVGLGRTLRAINADRVWELVYSVGFLSPGYECQTCSSLFSARPTRCTYCGSRLQPVSDVVERAVEHALRKHVKVEVVTGDAAAALKSAGGIGALLKTRTGTLEA